MLNTLLKEAVLNFRENDKEFFPAAFKRERFLDMKLTALRGYAEYASEKDVNVLMTKMLELLIKRGNQIDFFFGSFLKTVKRVDF